MRGLTLPTTNGWMVSWYTGEVRTLKNRDGKVIKEVRQMDSYESTDKAKVEAKAKQLEAEGYEIEMITECIF